MKKHVFENTTTKEFYSRFKDNLGFERVKKDFVVIYSASEKKVTVYEVK